MGGSFEVTHQTNKNMAFWIWLQYMSSCLIIIKIDFFFFFNLFLPSFLACRNGDLVALLSQTDFALIRRVQCILN